MNGKLNGMCFRVAVPCGVYYNLQNDAKYKDICSAMKTASGSLKGILGYTKDKIVTLKEWIICYFL